MAPGFQATAFITWLEARCEERHLTRMRLADLLATQLPYPRSTISVYHAVTGWLMYGKLPEMDYVHALMATLDASAEDLLALIPHSRGQQRRSARGEARGERPSTSAESPPSAAPPLARFRRSGPPPMGTTTEVRASGQQEWLAALTWQMQHTTDPVLKELLQPALIHRIAAQDAGLAGRIVPAEPGAEVAAEVAATETPAEQPREQPQEVGAHEGW